MNTQSTTRTVHEGEYLAEVSINLIPDDNGWGPYLTPADAQKLDEVRLALRNGDLAAASRLARVFRLVPVSSA